MKILYSSPEYFNVGSKMDLLFLTFLVFGTVISPASASNSQTVCDGNEANLRCPNSDVISIETSQYGRWSDRICRSGGTGVGITDCQSQSSLFNISSKCSGKTDCNFIVGQPFFSDPCPWTSKYLTITWSCIRQVVTCPARINIAAHQASYTTIRASDGGWFKDPLRHSDKVYFLGRVNYLDGVLDEFDAPSSIVTGKRIDFYSLDHRIDGTGFIVYDGHLYYNLELSRTMIKYNLARRRTAAQVDLPGANYHGTSPYATDLNSDINFVVDESGLWTVYATEKNNGNIVVSKMDPNTLKVLNTWYTSFEKMSALNAFIACGVLYVIDYNRLEITYIYNMTSNSEMKVNIAIPGIQPTTSSVKYNPTDRSLYIWNNKVASTYRVVFEDVIPPTSSTSTSVITTTTAAPPISTTAQQWIPDPKPDSEITSPKQSTTTPPIGLGFCSGKHASGLQWPDTRISTTANLSCPGDIHNFAYWRCDGSSGYPQWSGTEPDLTNCISPWLKKLESKIAGGGMFPTQLSLELSDKLRMNPAELKPWDIVVAVRLLDRLLDEEGDVDLESATLLTSDILKSTDVLLDGNLDEQWASLERQLQKSTANDLVAVVQRSAFYLAGKLIVKSYEKPLSSRGNHLEERTHPLTTLSIRIEPVRLYADGTRKHRLALFQAAGTDLISIDIPSVIKALHAKSTESIAIVYLSFTNLGKRISDDSGFGSNAYPVNSRLTTVSARRMLADRVWAPPSDVINLDRPFTFQLEHKHPFYSKHVCAYWKHDERSMDDGRWWRHGCRMVAGNASFSKCECNHFTNFVVLSSNKNFPLLGSSEDGVAVGSTSSLFQFVTVVRVASIISIVFLCGILIFIVRWRKRSDLYVIHVNLVITVATSLFILVIGIDQVASPTFCTVMAGSLHFFVLCSFSWSSIETVHHLVALKDMHEHMSRWKWYCPISYVIPLLLVGLNFGVDTSSYLNQPACWIQMNGTFWWLLVVPCCVATCVCFACIATLFYRLNKRHTTIADSEKTKRLRSDGVKSLSRIILLLLMWSLAFVWLCGFPNVALIFSFFCFLYGMASIITFCIFTHQLRLSRRWPEFHLTRKGGRPSHAGSSMRPLVRGDGSAPSSNYRFKASRDGTSTTIVPTATGANPLFPTLQADAEGSHLLLQHPHRSLSQDHLARIRDSEMKLRNSFSSMDEGDLSGTRRSHDVNNSRIERLYSSNIDPSIPSGSYHRCPPGECLHPHHYEQPASPHGHCSCTSSTTSSSYCYDHLRMDQIHRGASSISQMNRSRMPTPRNNPEYFIQANHRHQYETMGSFPDRDLPRGTNAFDNSHPHRYDVLEPDEASLNQIRAGNVACHPTYRQRHPDIPESSCSPTSTWLNSSYCPHSHVVGGKPLSRFEHRTPRNGRSSDPLSTDQGYDTDSQRPANRASGHPHSDGDQGTPGSSPGLSEQDANTQTNANLVKRSNSISGGSENDREVALINSPTSAPHREEGDFPSEVKPHCHDRNDTCDAIDTSKGGSIRISDTVTSWSAWSGSNPRDAFPEYGANALERKTTADPKVILEQARQNCEPFKNSSPDGDLVEERPPRNIYTLPGTSDADAKARINLRAGDMSITTHL